MSRATAAEVKEIISTTLEEEQVNPFLVGAHAFLEDALADEDYNAELRREIERWYTAYLISARDPLKKEKKFGDASVKYAIGDNAYLDRVKQLDHHGVISEILEAKMTAEVLTLDVPSHASE